MAHGPGNDVPSALDPLRSKSDAALAQPPPLTRVGGVPAGEPITTPSRTTDGRAADSVTRIVFDVPSVTWDKVGLALRSKIPTSAMTWPGYKLASWGVTAVIVA